MISIIVPVFNRQDLTSKFLESHWSLYRNSKDVEIIIVDNGSTDHTKKILNFWKTKFRNSQLKVVKLKENLGFSAGNNKGAEAASGGTFVFISNDVEVKSNYLRIVAGSINEDAACLYGAELLERDTGWNKFEKDENEFTLTYLAGWCIFCTKEIFEQLGKWDERYFPCDYEDLDLSYTAQNLRIPFKQVETGLFHVSGQTGMLLPDRLETTLKSQAKFLEKWNLKLSRN